MASFMDRFRSSWNAFKDQDEEEDFYSGSFGDFSTAGYGTARPDRPRHHITSEKSIVSAIYNRLSIDVAAVDIKHVKVDKNGRYESTIESGLNNCLTLEANIDQGARHFRQDMAMSLFDKGVIAIVPVDTTANPLKTGGFDILTLRVGEILTWFPDRVRVRLYNDRLGKYEELTLSKKYVAIVENPLYEVMNQPNSTLQRLIRKLSLLDQTDEKNSVGKLDMIIQLPYVIKSEARRQQAEQRRKDIEVQMTGSKYGIAYTDGTEKITQLNRPAENNLREQVSDLTELLYTQLGLTPEVFNGTADEKAMLNYHNRTIEPILTAITQAIKRTFLTKTARTQRQSIEFFRDPFKLVSVDELSNIADKFTRNEVLSSNEVRGIIGFKPAEDPKADELRNKNLPLPDAPPIEQTDPYADEY